MTQDNGADNRKKTILFACILCMLAALYLIFHKRAIEMREIKMQTDNPNLHIATIITRENDVRRRKSDLNQWNQAERRDKVSLGDSLFVSSKSNATLEFTSGGSLTFGENSFARFLQIEAEKMPSLICGNFLLHVEKSAQLKAGGTVTTFEGESGDVQVFLAVNQVPQFKVLNGNISVRSKKELEKALPPDVDDASLCPRTGVLDYTYRLYDLYEVKDLNLVERTPQPDFVFANHTVSFPQTSGKQTNIELSTHHDFRSRVEFQTIGNSFTFAKLHKGDNYWRVSSDGQRWSAPYRVFVQPKLLENASPRLENPVVHVPLFQNVTTIEMKLRTVTPSAGFVAEASLTADFLPDSTRLFWSPTETVRLSFSRAGSYFYRFRSVNAQQEISGWSETQRFDVTEPKIMAATRKVYGPRRAVPDLRKPAATEPTPMKVSATPPSDPTTTTRTKIEDLDKRQRRNDKYHDTRLSVQGFMWTMQSTQQYIQSTSNPVSAGLGMNYMSWWDQHGLEASLKTGVVGLNKAGNGTLKDFEARYHYRFVTGVPYNLVRELQTSFFFGYEMYRNGSAAFATKYDLMKFGTSLEFPISDAWAAGGEFVYGLGTDSSNKKEISGHFSYFFTRAWSLGAGYRIHFFEAGSTAAAPTATLPYREGYTEGYSILNYHF